MSKMKQQLEIDNNDQQQQQEREESDHFGHFLATKRTETMPLSMAAEEQKEENGGKDNEKQQQRSSSNVTALQLILNFAVIIGVAISWALAVQFRKSTLVIDPHHFYAPFSMVWFSTTFMCICYPAFLLYAFASGKKMRWEHQESLKILTPKGTFNVRHSVLKPLLFLFLWTTINYAYAQSLGLISAGAASSIMSANTAFVWILGWFLLKEQHFSVFKFIAVLLAMGGVVVVSLDHDFAGDALGIGLALASTIETAVYKVFYKLFNGNASLGQVSLFMSLIGVANVLLNTIPMVVLLHLNWDHIEWDHIPWPPLIGSALLGLVFNFLINFGIALLDPLVISIGTLFGLPISAGIDVLFRSLPISGLFVIGSALITVSFVFIAFPIEMGIRRIFCSGKNGESGEERGKVRVN